MYLSIRSHAYVLCEYLLKIAQELFNEIERKY